MNAVVSSSLGTPSGTVNFMDNSSGFVFATAVLVNGIATFSSSAEPLGVYNNAATYLGDSNFLPVTSAVFVTTVLDFTVGIATTGTSGSSATVALGGTANYQFDLAPAGSATFLNPVTFSLSGQPEGSNYTITPSTIPAGSGPTPVTLNIVLPQTSSMLHHDDELHVRGRRLAPFALALLLLPFARRMRRSSKRLSRLLSLLVLLVAGTGVTGGLSSCGTASGFYGGSPSGPKTYIITLTGKSGALSHSTTVTLTIP